MAERIVTMAEREQAARHNLEDIAQRSDIRHRSEVLAVERANARSVYVNDLTGQILGGLVAVGCVGGAIYTAVIGAHPTVSIALVGLPIAAIIKAFRSQSSPEKK